MTEVLGYTMAQLRGFSDAIARQAQERSREQLLISRGGQADEKGWKQLWKAFSTPLQRHGRT